MSLDPLFIHYETRKQITDNILLFLKAGVNAEVNQVLEVPKREHTLFLN